MTGLYRMLGLNGSPADGANSSVCSRMCCRTVKQDNPKPASRCCFLIYWSTSNTGTGCLSPGGGPRWAIKPQIRAPSFLRREGLSMSGQEEKCPPSTRCPLIHPPICDKKALGPEENLERTGGRGTEPPATVH